MLGSPTLPRRVSFDPILHCRRAHAGSSSYPFFGASSTSWSSPATDGPSKGAFRPGVVLPLFLIADIMATLASLSLLLGFPGSWPSKIPLPPPLPPSSAYPFDVTSNSSDINLTMKYSAPHQRAGATIPRLSSSYARVTVGEQRAL
ncbi:hypothetical protein BJ912DRAFT_1062801 [Pholiota molesta]|nr:hypothetical protein BJ912DRAFT_1062801 [Pholiota molesta]